ncbi:MAG: saccharopine dehydrogenase NADP-binding domain-containing protein [Candidatus Thermoplasmatota archaeon]|jgi:lysine 6-dehydrogenase|nr:saccharopine dehydrogenase NADP-binding domain-containing protein [Candidatus Thermoplasmatota archaeon]MCK5300438.1 saccharopine dehydrogenase NADP-binding domain-containing protein [Thermoplasmatales archaeon]
MNILVLGSGMMGQAITYDLFKNSNFDKITISDFNKSNLDSAKKFLNTEKIYFKEINVKNLIDIKKIFVENDIVISAIPYQYNFDMTKIAILTKTHFLDLGGNNKIVNKQKKLSKKAKIKKISIIPDCGLAPGIVSTITRDIVNELNNIKFVKIRVGGLPIKPKPPLNYQIVFSPNGLINEYVEDSIILYNAKIIKKKSMTEIEKIFFPKPFGEMEAFLTSGGCSTLPYTYREKIGYLDYKTIRYPGHCEKFKILVDIILGDEKPIEINNIDLKPREFLIESLKKNLPINKKDVVLLKIDSEGEIKGKKMSLTYTLIDYFNEKENLTAMMRTTGFPISIIAQMIERKIISKRGVYCPEEIVPCEQFFLELAKRGINIIKEFN